MAVWVFLAEVTAAATLLFQLNTGKLVRLTQVVEAAGHQMLRGFQVLTAAMVAPASLSFVTQQTLTPRHH
jgi:predicted transporter